MVNTYVKVLTSNFFAQETIRELNLLDRPEFTVALKGGDERHHIIAFISDAADLLASEAYSWARIPFIAVGLANQSPPIAPGPPAHTGHEVYQGQTEFERTATVERSEQAVGEAERAGQHRPIWPDEGEGLTVLDRLKWMVEGQDLSAAALEARYEELGSNQVFKTEHGAQTGGEVGRLGVVTSSLGEGGLSPVAGGGSRDAVMTEATEFFLDRLGVDATTKSYAISVAFTSVEPETAAQVANTMAELFVEKQLEAKRIANTGTLDWLTGRLNELRAQVVEADKAAETYREKNQLLASGRGLAFDDQELAALSDELIKARAERLATEAKLRRIKELRAKGESLDAVPEVLLSPYIVDLRDREMDVLRQEAQLRQEFGPLHPSMIEIESEKDKLTARIDAEIQRVIGSIANQIATIQVREDTLTAKLEEAKAGSLQNSRAEIQLRILEREAESTRTLYATFLDRFKQLTEQRELLEPGARVVSKAPVPTEPSFPKVKLMAGAGFMGSLMFGLLLAFVVDRVDGGLRTGRQTEAVLSAPSIGLIPKVGRAVRGHGPHLYLARKPISPYAEAIRAVQTALYFSNVDRPPQVVLVTSSLPAEGKTTLALSLATLLAASGHKTVALDLDLRAPALGRRFGKPRRGDLIDYMKGQKELDEILHEVDEVDNLHVIRTRRLAGSPTDVLASQKMAALMADLRARYQYVILDSPPLLGMSDALFAAHLADATVFVVRWSKTGEEVAQRALGILRDSGTRIAGVVLTQVNVRRQRKYSPAEVAQYYGRYRKYYVH